MFIKIWNYISAIGIQKEYDDILIKRITFSNQFNVVAILIFLFSGINNYALGDVYSAILIESLIVVCFVTFYLNKLHFHRFAISFFFTVLSIAIFYFDSYSGLLSGTFLYHFPLILAIAFVFDLREDKNIMFFHFTLIIGFLFINAITHYNIFKSDYLTDNKRYQMFVFNLPFSASSVGFFVYLMIQNNLKESFLYLQRIEERAQNELVIRKTLTEKNVLNAELHHRVKNNLAIISGLFSLKMNDDLHEDAKNVLLESRNRVRSMALIHNRLYKNDSFTDVNFDEYIQELIAEINASYPIISNSVKINTNVNNVSLNVNTAIPCGLILNELLTNSYKHAFKEKKDGLIDVSFFYESDYLIMTVKDNGIGLPLHYNKKQSLGVTVIQALTEQLDGTSSFSSNNGTCFELKFKSLQIQ
jgi:two-component sensor histidine kinase